MRVMKTHDLITPAAVVDGGLLQSNLEAMSKELPGHRLRPHVKAHKCTSLAKMQASLGHTRFTCATIAELVGMRDAGLSEGLLLANEVLETGRLSKLVFRRADITMAVDSEETITAAAEAGVGKVLVDVNVGLPRCGCRPEDAGRLADLARRSGLEVLGVMGYEGHIVGLTDREQRIAGVEASMALLSAAHDDVGGDIISGGGTGTYDINTTVTEMQAGSYALMDTAYGSLGLPFAQAF